VRVAGTDLLDLGPARVRTLRGKLVSYVPQEPAAALNPALRIRRQLEEMLEVHAPTLLPAARTARLRECLAEVKLSGDASFLERYPHQLSGGQQQRVVLAMAFIMRPALIVLDEPTTGLDVTTQAHVLRTIRTLCRAHGVAALYVSHDLAVVGELADDVLVVYAGRAVEMASRERLLSSPAHPYTRRLLASIPTITQRRALASIPGTAPSPTSRPRGCVFAPRCEHAVPACSRAEPANSEIDKGHFVKCARAAELAPTVATTARSSPRPALPDHAPILTVRDIKARYGAAEVLHGISLALCAQECVALVGESGSGKTTLAQSIVGLVSDWSGEIAFAGEVLGRTARARPMRLRRLIQYVFQNPAGSLNPRRTVGEIIALPLQHFFGVKARDSHPRVQAALDRVKLPRGAVSHYPEQLSGGERQRVAIARALICEPQVLICDEITSALDVSVQAAIIELLSELQEERELAMLFLTHNLALVRTIADRVVVMKDGRIVETGPVEAILEHPGEAYTRLLVADAPDLPQLSEPVPQWTS
jgi:peptide/nickel transport system ATP-binding protein